MPQNAQLQTIHVTALLLDEPLPGSLLDDHGRLLVAKGCMLDYETLEKLMIVNGGAREFVLGHDWPQPEENKEADTDELIQELEGRLEPVEDQHEKRTHERHKWQVVLTIDLEERTDDSLARRRIKATTVDISRGGFGFVFESFVHPGATVITTFKTVKGSPMVRGIVRHCICLGGRKHRVGVQFVHDNKST